jgi:hypothetical protein
MPGKRKKAAAGKHPKQKVSHKRKPDYVQRLSRQYKVPIARLEQLDSICRTHGTSLTKIPFWLLQKTPSRLVYWFKHGR